MSYTILSTNPTRFEMKESNPCDDCGEPVTILTDTIAGYLCDDCAKRFSNAAGGLARFTAAHCRITTP